MTATAPINTATGVSTTMSVTVIISEAMNPATITGSTLTLLDPSSASVPATVSYTAATNTATLTPSSSLASSTTYTIKVQGVADLAGNLLAVPYTAFFTTVAGGTSSTIWLATATPAVATASDSSAVELGVKFQANVSGTITGVRFYRGVSNTGTHVGNLWSSSGTLLATVTFTNESASGWQQATFSPPVAITANTPYVISYHTTGGHYAYDSSYFASSGVTNGPLTAFSNAAAGGNGVYRYGSSSGFPSQSYNATNYWVDVVFQP